MLKRNKKQKQEPAKTGKPKMSKTSPTQTQSSFESELAADRKKKEKM